MQQVISVFPFTVCFDPEEAESVMSDLQCLSVKNKNGRYSVSFSVHKPTEEWRQFQKEVLHAVLPYLLTSDKTVEVNPFEALEYVLEIRDRLYIISFKDPGLFKKLGIHENKGSATNWCANFVLEYFPECHYYHLKNGVLELHLNDYYFHLLPKNRKVEMVEAVFGKADKLIGV